MVSLSECIIKAIFLTDIGKLEYRECPPPETPEGWVRLRMRYVGICGSDIHYYVEGRIGDQLIQYPHILGHECSGEVIDGAGRFEPGERVYIEPAKVCHRCDQCLAGRENTCRNIQFLGNPGEGGGCMADEIAMPAENVFRLPEVVGLDEAVLLEPLCIACYAVMQSGLDGIESAAVVGVGPIGLTVMMALSDYAPKQVFVSEPLAYRRAKAEAMGASRTFDPAGDRAWRDVYEASGGGVQVVFECCGNEDAIDDAVHMLRPGGTLVLIGIPEGDGMVKYNQNRLRRNEITVVNVRRQNNALTVALPLLEKRRDVKDILITHRFAPDNAARGFDLVRDRADSVVKALIEF